VRLHQVARRTEDGWYAEAQVLQQERGLRWSGGVDVYGATLLAGCDGTRRWGTCSPCSPAAPGISEPEAAEQVLPVVERLVEQGSSYRERSGCCSAWQPCRGRAAALGFFADPPPGPESAPLEVVVRSSQLPDEPCLLNREEVAAGDHEVTVFDEVRRPSTRGRAGPDRSGRLRDGGGVETAQGSVALAGEHVVQCLAEGSCWGGAAAGGGRAGCILVSGCRL
jgi:hypothetical protein